MGDNRTRVTHGIWLDEAEAALARYATGPTTLVFQGDSENTTFRVRTQKEARFLLRRHQSSQQSHHTEAGLRSEMEWLKAILSETDIIAPEPIANSDGGWVTSVGGVLWTLTTWVEGRFLSDQRSPSRAFHVGAILARLHRHGAAWARPPGFERPRYNIQTVREHLEMYRHAAALEVLSPGDLAVIEATGEQVTAVMDAVSETPTEFGLVHGDFHNRNYLFRQGAVHPIDFSRCGDGYYLADLGYALCGLWHRSVGLAGYQSIRPLPQPHLRLIETFMVFGILGETAFHMRLAQKQGRSFDHPTWLVENLKRKFLQSEHFLIDW